MCVCLALCLLLVHGPYFLLVCGGRSCFCFELIVPNLYSSFLVVLIVLVFVVMVIVIVIVLTFLRHRSG